MLYSSYLGKFRQRDRILRRRAAAKQVPRGRAVGIDLWSQKDQCNNSREATLRNAVLKAVADLVDIRDGDMQHSELLDITPTSLPPVWVRTLKPGGQVALSQFIRVESHAP